MQQTPEPSDPEVLTANERALLGEEDDRARQRATAATLELAQAVANLRDIIVAGARDASAHEIPEPVRAATIRYVHASRPFHASAEHALIALKRNVWYAMRVGGFASRELLDRIVSLAIEAYYA